MLLPNTLRGILALIAAVLFVIIGLYTTTIGAVLVGGVLLVVGTYAIYVVLFRVDSWLKHGSLR
jgi:uncharacterized membrane protein HdeD (DUF308 family)